MFENKFVLLARNEIVKGRMRTQTQTLYLFDGNRNEEVEGMFYRMDWKHAEKGFFNFSYK